VARDKSLRLISALDREEKYAAQAAELREKLQRSIDDGRATRSSVSRFNSRIAKAESLERRAASEARNLVAEATPRRSYKKFAPTVQKRVEAAKRKERREKKKVEAQAAAAGVQEIEFEMGVDYTTSDGADKSSQVMVNWRMSRRDGAKMTMPEAKNLARDMHRGVAPSDLTAYHIRGVNWFRPEWEGKRGPKYGGVDDLDNFSAILQTVDAKDIRVGAVKPDRE